MHIVQTLSEAYIINAQYMKCNGIMVRQHISLIAATVQNTRLDPGLVTVCHCAKLIG